jgi:hypothetical protein
MENANLFTATVVLTAYVDEKGNVKLMESSWDGSWDSLFEEENENA